MNAFEIMTAIKAASEEYAGMDAEGNCDGTRLMAFEAGCMFMLKLLNTPGT
jgi:hypothetical protein